MSIEKKICQGCSSSLNIMPSGLCRRCSEYLARLFSLKPETTIENIRSIQRREKNTACFNTGAKKGCNQGHCEWLDICDQEAAKATA